MVLKVPEEGRSVKRRGLGFGVWGLGFGVWSLGFGVWGLEFGVWRGLEFGVWGPVVLALVLVLVFVRRSPAVRWEKSSPSQAEIRLPGGCT